MFSYCDRERSGAYSPLHSCKKGLNLEVSMGKAKLIRISYLWIPQKVQEKWKSNWHLKKTCSLLQIVTHENTRVL